MAAYGQADEDFKRRYDPQVPSYVPPPPPSPVDASIANVNAAARSASLPGVGQAGSTPITDQTNLNVAAAMERADLANRIVPFPSQEQPGGVAAPTVAATAMDEFSQRRQEIETQKTQLMAKLGMVPPSAGGFAAVVLPSTQRPRGGGPSEYEKTLQQLNYLDNQSRQLLQEHHYSAIENARTAHEDLARQTHIQVSSGLAKVLNGINQINHQYAHGSPEARSAILDLVGGNDPDIAAARGTKSFETLVKPYTNMHDLATERARFVAAFGREPTSVETTATGGVNLRAGVTKDVPPGTLKYYTTLKVNRAEQQAYLDKEVEQASRGVKVDPKLQSDLQKKIDVLDAQIGAVHQQFPSLAIGAPTTSSATKPNQVRQNGVIYHLQPDGNYK